MSTRPLSNLHCNRYVIESDIESSGLTHRRISTTYFLSTHVRCDRVANRRLNQSPGRVYESFFSSLNGSGRQTIGRA